MPRKYFPFGGREVEIILDYDIMERHGLQGQAPPTMNKIYVDGKGTNDDLIVNVLHEAFHKGSYLFSDEQISETDCRVCSELTLAFIKRAGVFDQVVGWLRDGENTEGIEKEYPKCDCERDTEKRGSNIRD